MMPHIFSFNEENVATDQPWLSPAEQAHAKMVGDMFNRTVREDMEGWLVDHLGQRASEGDQEAINKLYPMCHYILTEDYRIVQEPNFYRWGMFLERGKHRVIDKTDICSGIERDHSYFSNSWAVQQRRKRRFSDAPSFKSQEMYVSTVFIGGHENELFETMIFGGWLDTNCWRSSTLAEAKKNHWDAVTISHQHKNYMKKHGRAARKDWIRASRFWELARKRGYEWAVKHFLPMQRLDDRLRRIPGQPNRPLPDYLAELAQHFLPRQNEILES